eukprot:scaffold79960_cov30-Phaeocystis_antarctica.AAC.1
MRACSWTVRGAHGTFEGRRHTPAARSSRWVSYTTRGSSRHSRRSSESTCEGTGGASVGARRTGRRGASARHSAMRRACRHGVALGERERESRPAPACLTRLPVRQAFGFTDREKTSERCAAERTELFGFPLLARMINKRPNRHARRHTRTTRPAYYLPRVVIGVFSEHGHHGHHGHL